MIISPKCNKGFTLAELLIALTILGVIATFTIPKILHSQDNAQRAAVFKETIAAYSQIVYTGVISGDIVQGNCPSCGSNEYPFNDYVETKINYIEQCSQAIPDGCWVNAACIEGTSPGHRLASGATTCGVTSRSTNTHDNFWVDWNGPDEGSNTEGDDQIRLRACWTDGCPDSQKPGTVISHPSATSQALFVEIFR